MKARGCGAYWPWWRRWRPRRPCGGGGLGLGEGLVMRWCVRSGLQRSAPDDTAALSPPPCRMVPFDQTSCGDHAETTDRDSGRTDANATATGLQGQKSYSHFCRALLGDSEGSGQIHSPSECRKRYRRLLKTATDEERRNYLGRLIVEEQQKQKNVPGDSRVPILRTTRQMVGVGWMVLMAG